MRGDVTRPPPLDELTPLTWREGPLTEGSLANFVDYLDEHQTAGGDLPTSVELTEDVDGVGSP